MDDVRYLLVMDTKDVGERAVIREITSPWSSPILLVPKKDGSYRFCADFRALNDVTETEIFQLPSIRECRDSLGGSAMFSTLDLHSGYWQIEIDPKDRHKTAFTTETGNWEFVVMPFGVKNAPTVLCCLMSDVMRGLVWNGVAIYLDDIIVGGTNFEEHLLLLKEVLREGWSNSQELQGSPVLENPAFSGTFSFGRWILAGS
jgi:hypothetical protein